MASTEKVVAVVLGARGADVREAAHDVAVVAATSPVVELAEPKATLWAQVGRGRYTAFHFTALGVVAFLGEDV